MMHTLRLCTSTVSEGPLEGPEEPSKALKGSYKALKWRSEPVWAY